MKKLMRGSLPRIAAGCGLCAAAVVMSMNFARVEAGARFPASGANNLPASAGGLVAANGSASTGWNAPGKAPATVSFQRTDYATGTNPQSMATGDFNHDGKMDMAVSDYNGGGAGSVSVFLGSGSGSFGTKVDYATGDGPVLVAAADVNGDGILDLVTANDTGGSVSVLLGNGDGTFKAHVDYAAGSFPHWVAIGDLNGDGNADLVVSNEGANTVSIFLGNGDGTFQAQITAAAPSEPYAIGIADFNHDGKADLAVTGYENSVAGIFLGRGNGTFEPYVSYPAGEGPAALVLGDFNHDGNTDVAIADYNNGNTGFASVLLGKGDGTFGATEAYTAGTGPDGIAAGDFNGDGKTDLAVGNLLANTVSVLYGNGDGTFETHVDFPTGDFPIGIAAWGNTRGGFGSENISVANDLSATVSVLLNTAATNVALTSAPNPSKAGQVVRFTAMVTPALAGEPTPTGTVTLSTGSRKTTITLANGVAAANIKIPAAGSYKFSALYSGDANYNQSASPTITQVVTQ